MNSLLKKLYGLAKEAGLRMSDDQTTMMGAALAYYMMFSIAPLLIFAIGAAGVVFGGGARANIFHAVRDVVGAQSAGAIQSMVEAAAAKPHAGAVATIVGAVTLLVGASGVFQQLQQSLNIIWRVAPLPGAAWRALIRQRLLSFGMVAVLGFLLLVSLIVSAAISAVGAWAGGLLPGMRLIWSAVNFLVSFAITSGLFAAVLKLLPDVRLSWRDVGAGGALTAFLFEVGKALIAVYIGRAGVASSYGAAGSLIVVLLWVFFTSQILFFGAEITRALYVRAGKPIEPRAGAELTEIPFVAAAAAGRAVEAPSAAAGPDERRQARESAYWVAGASAAAGAFLLRHARGRGRAAAGGFACGAAAVLLTLLEIPRLAAPDGDEDKQPSTASRLIARIPTKVKLAAAGGALKSGGKEALSETVEAVREKAGV